MIKNLNHLLEATAIKRLIVEVDRNVLALYRLGDSHFLFARSISDTDWRQEISRLYYAAYNMRRALLLKDDGSFSTSSSDHQQVDVLPNKLPNKNSYSVKLRDLREDRNLADYSHLGSANDLIMQPDEAMDFVNNFRTDCSSLLKERGISI